MSSMIILRPDSPKFHHLVVKSRWLNLTACILILSDIGCCCGPSHDSDHLSPVIISCMWHDTIRPVLFNASKKAAIAHPVFLRNNSRYFLLFSWLLDLITMEGVVVWVVVGLTFIPDGFDSSDLPHQHRVSSLLLARNGIIFELSDLTEHSCILD